MAISKTSPPRASDRLRRAVRPVHLPGSRRRRRLYTQDLRALARFLWEQGRTLTHATEKDAAMWVRALKKRLSKGSTPADSSVLHKKIMLARGFFEHLKAMRSTNPFNRYPAARFPRLKRTALDLVPSEVNRLVATMNPKSPWGRRNRAMALLRCAAHLEVSEICRLKRDQLVRTKGGDAIRLPGKRGAFRKIPLGRKVSVAVRMHLAKNSPQGLYLFQAMPGNPATPGDEPRRKAKPLSKRWVSSMLLGAARAARLSIARA